MDFDRMTGVRVRLLRCNDQYTTLEPGTEGTVIFIDDFNTVFVRWDNGSLLGLIYEAGDRFEVVSPELQSVIQVDDDRR